MDNSSARLGSSFSKMYLDGNLLGGILAASPALAVAVTSSIELLQAT